MGMQYVRLCPVDSLVVIPSDGISISHIVIHTNIYPPQHFLSLNRFLSPFSLNLGHFRYKIHFIAVLNKRHITSLSIFMYNVFVYES